MKTEEMDFLHNGLGSGSVAQRLQAAGMHVNALRPFLAEDGRAYVTVNGKSVPVMNATLRYDEWKEIDQVVVKEVTSRLSGIATIEGRGLVHNLTNGLGKTVLQSENADDFSDAEITMDGISRVSADRPNFETVALPLPITHKDFGFSARVLAASRGTGETLDMTSVEVASRKVGEQIENTLFNGAKDKMGNLIKMGGNFVYGLLNFPSRNTGSLTAHWNDSAATGATILADVLAMKAALTADGFYGPYALFIPANFETALEEDYASGYPKSVRARLLEIERLESIAVSDKLTADNAVMVSLQSDVIRIVNGLPIAPVEWMSQGNLMHHFKVMGIKVPQIRATQGGKCGIAHWS